MGCLFCVGAYYLDFTACQLAPVKSVQTLTTCNKAVGCAQKFGLGTRSHFFPEVHAKMSNAALTHLFSPGLRETALFIEDY